MFKNITIILLLATLSFMTAVAVRNDRPVCDNLKNNNDIVNPKLICEYSLGDIRANQAHVIMRTEQ